MVKTKNIKFCAYLKLKGQNPVEVVKLAHGKAEYVYNIDPKEWDIYQINFNSSDYLTFANNLEDIKNLAY